MEPTYGKDRSWDVEKVVQLSSALRAIEDGVEKADVIFPSEPSDIDTAKPESKSMAKVKESLNEGDRERKKPDTLTADDVRFPLPRQENKCMVSIGTGIDDANARQVC